MATTAAASRGASGASIIAGKPVTPDPGAGAFSAVSPGTGNALPVVFACATPEQVEEACAQAWDAFYANQSRSGADRATLLERCADLIVGLGDELVLTVSAETGLPPARVVSERERTAGTLRMFAELVREGSWVRASIDDADPNRRPVPRPGLKQMLRPMGPVAVFGASNFPLAYSTAGGDTASALGAGCPVVVKGHGSHPASGELVARAVSAAVAESKFHPGTFSFLHAGGSREIAVGVELVRNQRIRAVGFTGSFTAGMSLARICAERPDPIPVFAEMGSANPVFLLPGALESQARAIAERLHASITNSSGQMCTCPGLILGVRGDGYEAFLRALAEMMNQAGPMTMLSRRVRAGFIKRTEEISAVPGVEIRGGSPQAGHRASGSGHESEEGIPVRCSAALYRCTFETFRASATLREECFGPAALAVVCDNDAQLVRCASLIQGSLTGSIFAAGPDNVLARQLQQVLESRAGRIVFNGVPTGVEVCTSMVHGGPFPATNKPHTTAVGPRAIERWCRPICYQNAPEALLPQELWEMNPLKIWRTVNGLLTKGK